MMASSSVTVQHFLSAPWAISIFVGPFWRRDRESAWAALCLMCTGYHSTSFPGLAAHWPAMASNGWDRPAGGRPSVRRGRVHGPGEGGFLEVRAGST